MITITPAKEIDIRDILAKYDQILSENLDELKFENTMILVERGKIHGVSSYTTDGLSAKLNVLYVDENMRRLKFGDSLIKATLNLIDKREIKKAYIVMPKEYEDFLKSASLLKTSTEDLDLESNILISSNEVGDANLVIYHAILPDFFNTACRSSRKN